MEVDFETKVKEAFGQVRTEYLGEPEVYRMFTQPIYWTQLRGLRPCFLIGGRGTGKTTALRNLSFRGQAALSGANPQAWEMIGMYWRIDASVVNSFRGRGVPQETWDSLFSHYLNLQLMQNVLGFVEWRSEELGENTDFDGELLDLACISAGVEPVDDLRALRRAVRIAIARLQGALNGPSDGLAQTAKSVAGVPLGYLVQALMADSVVRRSYFAFCIDEFENLGESQQRILNTLIKHSGDSSFTFKVGLREATEWSFPTLAQGQPLQEPADYTSVRIAENLGRAGFDQFASQICQSRLNRVLGSGDSLDVRTLFPALGLGEEAELLGGGRIVALLRKELVDSRVDGNQLRAFDAMPILEKLLVRYWAESKRVHVQSVLREALADGQRWRGRVNNYGYALLFTIAGRGAERRKYYSGWQTFLQLADGNIRYVLQLVGEAISRHVAQGGSLASEISPALQTQCAAEVGERLVRELKGISERGAQLSQFVLGLGRVFNIMARNPAGHTPEVNQFRLTDADAQSYEEAKSLLGEGVSQGALVAFSGDKNSRTSSATKTLDYQLHPIYAPFFEYSHRSKRRMTVSSLQVMRLATGDTSSAVRELAGERGGRSDMGLPIQLELYGDLYAD